LTPVKKDPLLRRLDRLAKRTLVKCVLWCIGRLPEQNDFSGPLDSIVILAQEKAGDAILLTPLIRNLHHTLPHTKIHLVSATSTVYEFYKNDPAVYRAYWIKASYPAYFRTMRRQRFDLLFSAKDHPSFTFLYQARLLKARFRVGIAHPYHQGFFNHLIDREFHRHIIEKNCALLDFLGVRYRPEDCRPYLPEQPVSRTVTTLALQIAHQQVIGINLSAGDPDREWSLAKWRVFMKRIDSKQPVLVLAMPERGPDKHALRHEFSNVIISPDTSNLYEAGWLVCQLAALVTPDTALVHVASCYNVPVVGLYRADADHARRFYPYLVPHRQLLSTTYRIEDIPVDDAITALGELRGNVK
jgi:ADP-heptose:LPS heptosyltransferase